MYYKDFLRYRKPWLGVALLWIILYHLPLNLGFFTFPQSIGYGGVDICFFASGIGCFYSLSSDSDVFNFMKRRLKRLAPTYLIFMAIWLSFQYIWGNFDFQMAIGNIFALQHFTGKENSFNWYISAIFLFYLLAPYFKAIAEQKSIVPKIVFLTFLLVCTIPFWNTDTYAIIFIRFPIFYLGMLFADLCKKDRIIDKKAIVILAVSFVAGLGSLLFAFVFAEQYLWSYGLYWYPFILITPPLCLAISYACMLLEKCKATSIFIRFLSLCGDYSFELYLVHILMFAIIPNVMAFFNNPDIWYVVWGIGFVCIPIGCYFIRYLSGLLQRLIAKQ